MKCAKPMKRGYARGGLVSPLFPNSDPLDFIAPKPRAMNDPLTQPMPQSSQPPNSPMRKMDQDIAMQNAVSGLSNTERYQMANPLNQPYKANVAAPGSSAEASQLNRQSDITTSLRNKLAERPTGYADGGKPETTDELLARMAAKYGGAAAVAARPEAVAPAPAPAPAVQQPAQQGGIGGAYNALKNRKEQLDRAINGYSSGGKIKGPGTPTSDSIPADVEETGEQIQVSTDERILSKSQDMFLEKIATDMGFPNLDAMLEAGTGKPVGPTVKGGKMHAADGKPPKKEWWERGDTIQLSEEGSKANRASFANIPGEKETGTPIGNLLARAWAGEWNGAGARPIEWNWWGAKPKGSASPAESQKSASLAAEAPSNNQGAARSIAMGADTDAAMHNATRQTALPNGIGSFAQNGRNYDVQNTGQEGIQRVNVRGQNPLFTNIDPGKAVEQIAGMKPGAIQTGGSTKDAGWIDDGFGNDRRPTIAMQQQLAQLQRDRYGRDLDASTKDPRVMAAAVMGLANMNQDRAAELAGKDQSMRETASGLDNQVKRNSLSEYASLQKALADYSAMPAGPERDAALEAIAARQGRNLPDKSQLMHAAGGSDPNDPLGVKRLPDRVFEKDRYGNVREITGQQQSGPSQADLEYTAKKYGMTVDQVKAKLAGK